MIESMSGGVLDGLRSVLRSSWAAENAARLRLLDALAGIEQIGVGSLQLRGVADLVAIDLRCTRRFALGLIADMRRFTARSSLTGEPLEPVFPIVAAGLREGLYSFDQARVIAAVVEKLPDDLRAEYGVAVEEQLAAYACEYDPISLKKLADRIVALLDEDGPVPGEELQHRRRSVQLHRYPDGTGLLTAHLTAVAAEYWDIILTSLAHSRTETAAARTTTEADADADGNPVDGTDPLGRDPRNLLQRQHDAFEEAGRLLLENGKLPDHAGLPAELIVTIDLKDLEQRTGHATTHHGGSLTVGQVLHLAADLNVIPVILDQDLGLVAHGRGRRIASTPQRKAVFARDRGCTFPGCTKTAGQSQVHHMTEWTDLGETNPDNLTITCGYHNNEAPRHGWKAHVIQGIPHWTPPEWQDPEQQPRRNYQHHPELLMTLPPPPRQPTSERELF